MFLVQTDRGNRLCLYLQVQPLQNVSACISTSLSPGTDRYCTALQGHATAPSTYERKGGGQCHIISFRLAILSSTRTCLHAQMFQKHIVLTASVLINLCSSIGLREISNVSQAVFVIVQLKHKCYDLMHYQIIALANMH